MVKIKLTRKKTIIGLVGAVFAVVAGLLSWLAYYTVANPSATPMPVSVLPVDEVQTTALEYIHSNDIDGGLKFYDEQINNRQDSKEKRQLLLDKSDFALNAKRPEDAVSAAKQADATASDIASVISLAHAYEDAGDKKQAVSYYRKAIDISPKDNGMGSRYNSLWEEKIAELSK